MKISGPGQPPVPGAAGTEAPTSPTGASPSGAPAEATAPFSSKVAGPRAATEAKAAAEPTRPGHVATVDLAAELQSGKLTSRATVEQVLERVVTRQVGMDAPAAVRDRVRVALQDAIDSDPLLAEKIRQLG